jgi:hypothetical protein
MWEKLNLVRVYTKPKGRQPDYTAPVVLRSTACTVEDFVRALLTPSPLNQDAYRLQTEVLLLFAALMNPLHLRSLRQGAD